MPFTIRIFGRWTARVDNGVWCVLEGPPEVSVVLNSIADAPPSGVHVDVGLIRFGGRVDYVDLVSSSFVEESLQVLGGVRISIRGSLVAAGERPVAI